MNLRPAWATEQVQGQPGQIDKTLSQNTTQVWGCN